MTLAPRFETGDVVRGLDGAFRGFVGTVIGYDADANRLKVIVPVFGRQTAVDLDRRHVEKVR